MDRFGSLMEFRQAAGTRVHSEDARRDRRQRHAHRGVVRPGAQQSVSQDEDAGDWTKRVADPTAASRGWPPESRLWSLAVLCWWGRQFCLQPASEFGRFVLGGAGNSACSRLSAGSGDWPFCVGRQFCLQAGFQPALEFGRFVLAGQAILPAAGFQPALEIGRLVLVGQAILPASRLSAGSGDWPFCVGGQAILRASRLSAGSGVCTF